MTDSAVISILAWTESGQDLFQIGYRGRGGGQDPSIVTAEPA